MKASILLHAVAIALFTIAAGAQGQTKNDPGGMQHGASASAGMTQGGAMSDGVIRKVDKDAGKITIKHGPIQNLDMPAMTMVFRVSNPEILDLVKAGDKVKFEAQQLGGAITVTKIESVK